MTGLLEPAQHLHRPLGIRRRARVANVELRGVTAASSRCDLEGDDPSRGTGKGDLVDLETRVSTPANATMCHNTYPKTEVK